MHLPFKIPYSIAEDSLCYLCIIAGFAISLVVTIMVKKRSKASHHPDSPLTLANKQDITEARPSEISCREIREATGSVPDRPAA